MKLSFPFNIWKGRIDSQTNNSSSSRSNQTSRRPRLFLSPSTAAATSAALCVIIKSSSATAYTNRNSGGSAVDSASSPFSLTTVEILFDKIAQFTPPNHYQSSLIWFFMASTLFLAAILSWWIGVVYFSPPISASSNTATGNQSSKSASSSTVEAFRGALQRHIIQPASDHIITPIQSVLSDSVENLDDLDNDSANKSRTTTTTTTNNNKAAASAVSSSFDFFFNSSAATADLSPPFAMLDDYKVTTEELTSVVPQPDVTHFCFLIHGHRGLSKDLAYFQTVMQREATIEKKRNGLVPPTVKSTMETSEDDDGSVPTSGQSAIVADLQPTNTSTDLDITNKLHKRHDMVVYSSVCNEGKTTDGIENGGDRLVDEIRTVIDDEMKKRYPELLGHEIIEDDTDAVSTTIDQKIHDVTISMLGNSLGGLFGRYAIAKLLERYCEREVRTMKVKGVQNDKYSSIRAKIKKSLDDGGDDILEEECWILDRKYRIHLNIFCTTATPHLGVSGHTWFRIPRTAEIGVAHAMGNTGKDLFRLNDLLHKMATDRIFLGPLGAFRKRIAYANCYGTDFVVPAGTAAFLSENSTYPHHFIDDYILDENGLVIAALHTPTSSGEGEDGDEAEEHSDELHEMSSSLDKLGWKKVLVDVRKEMPSVAIPKVLRRSSLSGSDSNDNGDDQTNENNENTSMSTTAKNKVEELKKQKVVQSKDIADAVSSSADSRVSLPLGHNMIVAFSRNRVFTYANKAGRPIVDSLAKELVEDIFKWDGIYEGPVLSTTMESSAVRSSSTSSSPAAKKTRLISDTDIAFQDMDKTPSV